MSREHGPSKSEALMNESHKLDYIMIFQDEYDEPVVEIGPNPVPGIHIGAACERVWLAEDSFVPPA